jgi:hypothetical protein
MPSHVSLFQNGSLFKIAHWPRVRVVWTSAQTWQDTAEFSRRDLITTLRAVNGTEEVNWADL